MEQKLLEGGCFVVDPEGLDYASVGDWREAVVIDGDSGASAMSQYRVRVDHGNQAVRRLRFIRSQGPGLCCYRAKPLLSRTRMWRLCPAR